jgi:hypothetical protein
MFELPLKFCFSYYVTEYNFENILLIMENATPRNSEYFLMKLGTVIRC